MLAPSPAPSQSTPIPWLRSEDAASTQLIAQSRTNQMVSRKVDFPAPFGPNKTLSAPVLMLTSVRERKLRIPKRANLLDMFSSQNLHAEMSANLLLHNCLHHFINRQTGCVLPTRVPPAGASTPRSSFRLLAPVTRTSILPEHSVCTTLGSAFRNWHPEFLQLHLLSTYVSSSRCPSSLSAQCKTRSSRLHDQPTTRLSDYL